MTSTTCREHTRSGLELYNEAENVISVENWMELMVNLLFEQMAEMATDIVYNYGWRHQK